MSDRSVRVILEAKVDGFINGFRRASLASKDLARDVATASNKHQEAAATLGKVGLVAGGVLAFGVGAAVKTFANFDEAMSGVRANVQGTPAEMQKLETSIREAGKSSVFTSTESANAAEELAKAGFTASQIMGGGLTGALNLAAAGGIGLADAAETAATTMQTFGLQAKDVGHIADVLAAGANSSTASVDSLSQGMRQGGLVAKSMGLSLEDTVGTLAAFDQAGLKGADAGTSLKTMLTALVSPSKAAARTMDELGIEVFDAQGKFVGMQGLQDQLRKSMSGLTQEQRGQAMATIFGSDAVRAANVLYADSTGKIGDWSRKVNDSGAAAEMAGKRTNNLKGDLEKLKGAIEDALIGQGGGIGQALRPLVQGLTTLVDLVGRIPSPVLTAGGALIGLGSAALVAFAGIAKVTDMSRRARSTWADMGDVAGRTRDRVTSVGGSAKQTAASLGAIVKANGQVVTTTSGARIEMGRFGSTIAQLGTHVSTISRMQGAFVDAAAGASRFPRAAGGAAAAMTGLKAAGSGLLGVLGGPWGLVLTGATVALGLWAAKQQDAAQKAAASKQYVDSLTDSFDKQTGAITTATRAAVAKKAIDDGLIATGRSLGLSASQVVDAMMGVPTAVDLVNTSVKNLSGAADETAGSLGAFGGAQNALAADAGKRAANIRDFGKAINGASGELKAAQANQRDMNEAMKTTGAAASTAASGTSGYEQAMARVTDAQKKAKTAADNLRQGIDGVNNVFLQAEASSDAFQAAIDAATSALKENGKSLDNNTAAGRANREALRGIAQSGVAYADSLAKQGSSAQTVATQIYATRDAYIRAATSMGYTREEASRLADQYIKMPAKVTTTIEADTARAKAQVAAMGYDFDKLPKELQTRIIADGKVAKTELATVSSFARKVPTDVGIGVSTDAPVTTRKINDLTVAAIGADAESVNISVEAPLTQAVTDKLRKLDGVTVSADRKSVEIDTGTAHYPATLGEVRKLLSTTRDKSMTVTAYTNAGTVKGSVRSLLSQAHDKSFTISARLVRSIQGGMGRDRFFNGYASGGPVGGYAGSYATGGAVRDVSAGGRVTGPGTGTSDSIVSRGAAGQTMRLSNYEHVITAAEVNAAGGHATWYQVRRLANQGRLQGVLAAGTGAGYANGGDATPAMIRSYWQPSRFVPRTIEYPHQDLTPLTTELVGMRRELRSLRALQDVPEQVRRGAADKDIALARRASMQRRMGA